MLDIATDIASFWRRNVSSYLDDILAMPLCFVCQQLDELVPSQVSYGSVHRVFVPTLHVLHGQVLYAICVNLVLVAHLACQLVQEIFSLPCYLRIQLRYLFLLAPVLCRSLLQCRKFLLVLRQFVLRLLQEHWIVYLISIVKCHEGLHAKVNSSCSFPW